MYMKSLSNLISLTEAVYKCFCGASLKFLYLICQQPAIWCQKIVVTSCFSVAWLLQPQNMINTFRRKNNSLVVFCLQAMCFDVTLLCTSTFFISFICSVSLCVMQWALMVNSHKRCNMYIFDQDSFITLINQKTIGSSQALFSVTLTRSHMLFFLSSSTRCSY